MTNWVAVMKTLAYHGTDRMDFARFDIAAARIFNLGLHFGTKAAVESRIAGFFDVLEGEIRRAPTAARLMLEYGNGYDARNLRYMRSFYLSFPIWNAVRSELGWTHYRILMREGDPIAREWYMNECVAGGWSSRDLDRQVSTDAYHRRLAAANPDRRRKQKELPLSKLPAKKKDGAK